jgi:glycerol kinase
MGYILALDQGTSSSRALVFDQHGHMVAMAQQELTQHYPQAGWVEHNPLEIWTTQLAVARLALQSADLQASQLAAVGMTNQRETTVLWDRRTGVPVAPAIVWQDRRTSPACDRLRSHGHARTLQRKTGLVLNAYFSATKLQWLLDHNPGVRARAEAGDLAFGTVDSWLLWKLTGGRVHATDTSNASRTMLFNIHTLRWDADLLALFDIPPQVLPQVLPSSTWFGACAPEWLGAAVDIMGVAGDQQAATFGQACFAPGMAKNTYGTGCFMLMNTGQTATSSRHQLLSTVAWTGPASTDKAKVLPSQTCYALEGSVFMAGATIQWLRDGLGIIQQASDVEALAASVPDTQGVTLVPAFVGLGAPYWDSHARAALWGMSRSTQRAHIARAALEAIALQTADVFDAMAQDSGLHLSELRVDGGACRNDLLMQMQADVLGVDVVRPSVTETTALGVAYLAGLACGLWANADELTALWKTQRTFKPSWSPKQRADAKARWHEAVQRTRSPA